MKNLELENYGVLEMNSSEMEQEKGGFFWCILGGIALAMLIRELF